ncbi:MAG: hypothetical protein EA422_01340 [Gemmatimonadales bacterium]|nr:MAG: hypothetical protein EA422_01340 [Gemmatimonadales bacterium]
MSVRETRIRTSKNMSWTPRPGWVTVRLVGTCADPALRRGQVVAHAPLDLDPVSGAEEELLPGTLVIVLSKAAHLVEDDLHLIPEEAVVAVGEILP